MRPWVKVRVEAARNPAVAKTPGVTIGHVYVAKHRIARLLRKEIDGLEAKEI